MDEEMDCKCEGGESPCFENKMDASPGGSESARGGGITAGELQEMMDQIPPEMLAPDLPMLLASMSSMMEDQAWRHLGLIANPVTRQIEKDLQKARIAIDVMAYIVTRVSPLVSDSQRRDLQAKVSTLQMNFVEQSKNG
jgi:hypothetical protein